MTRGARGSLAVAVLAAGAIVLLAPLVGEARSWLRRAIPDEFSLALNAGLAIGVTAVVGTALWQIRDRRAWRYLATLAGVGVAGAFALATASPIAAQNAVERYHFVEYGVVAALFYRAWRSRGDLSVVILPVIAGLIVSTVDEAWQWFVPERVGEWRDIFLNLGAIWGGVLVSIGVAPPIAMTATLSAGSRRRVWVLAAALALPLAAFLQLVHFGRLVQDPQRGTFTSRYTGDELLRLGADRAARWAADPPPLAIRRFSREDQYLAEAMWHVRARNDAWAVDVNRAWHENLLLERYFGPVLAVPTYLAPAGVRWPEAQRADAEARKGPDAVEFVSRAAPEAFLLLWPRGVFWAIAGTIVAVFLVLGVVSDRRPRNLRRP